MPRSLTDAPPGQPLGSRRAEVLEKLRAARRPLGVLDLAAATGLHANTARFHLDGLVEDGLATREIEVRTTPGRRRVVYAVHGETPGPKSYSLLAEMLTGLVVSMGGGGAQAAEAGRDWGRHLVERGLPSQRASEEESVTRLQRLLEDVGFEPETVQDGSAAVVNLHHCPFRDVAVRHTDVVCAIHLGLIQGALGELRSPWRATGLEPFVEPTLCVARLEKGTAPELPDEAAAPEG
ncbi:helix-turn-helix domain-containing protein [Sanguibacter sp. 25GB23B1]|uniref:helix-turn-helix transcriptional regulator n=1 Tax=unclassified Sanguibacter TaxID=2645534 RepID=UPI0032B00847